MDAISRYSPIFWHPVVNEWLTYLGGQVIILKNVLAAREQEYILAANPLYFALKDLSYKAKALNY